jgi:hypothetical protein
VTRSDRRAARAIFTRCALPAPSRLYWSVAIGGRGAVDHFLPAEACAARIESAKREGLTSPADAPERGGDDLIRPVILSRRHDEAESPIALAFELAELPGPVCGLSGSEIALVYAERLTANFVVSCAEEASDEWWSVRPNAYRAYLDDLRIALTARSITMVIEPRTVSET